MTSSAYRTLGFDRDRVLTGIRDDRLVHVGTNEIGRRLLQRVMDAFNERFVEDICLGNGDFLTLITNVRRLIQGYQKTKPKLVNGSRLVYETQIDAAIEKLISFVNASRLNCSLCIRSQCKTRSSDVLLPAQPL
ncbi:hypothetical protein COY07_04020 [Candidatus Peregrinibacteria bacterium CG_4_10_14_0_2_um_filter_43_11]|nr:MAG: hypothetical protein COY07_04020 [Candidatus Peregrinibacteria bacterium CG_4_10_14_0_2_um_filter_43_11]